MISRYSLGGRVAVLLAALATVGGSAAYAATALADGGASDEMRTINGSFCIDSSHQFCMQAEFEEQRVKNYCAGASAATCTPNQNSGGILSLRPGNYLLSVKDTSRFHDFTLRSCPGSETACDKSSGGEDLPITTDAFESQVPVTTIVHLTHGTYRLFCGNDSHEGKGMYVDITVGGVGQVG
jgi:hypothetical protein